jgi:hypothetical protein
MNLLTWGTEMERAQTSHSGTVFTCLFMPVGLGGGLTSRKDGIEHDIFTCFAERGPDPVITADLGGLGLGIPMW